MTASELLAMLGRAWSRLLLYPGGLAAFAAIWLTLLLSQRRTITKNHEPAAPDRARFSARSSIVLPWLGLALLPLPLAVTLPRQADIVVTLALLEWPQILAIRQALQAGDTRRLAAALNSYPALILATLALAQPAGSLEIAAIARVPDEQVPKIAGVLHWLGAVALALALAPALGLGPFADRGQGTGDRERGTGDRGQGAGDNKALPHTPIPNPQPPTPNPYLGLRLRALGLIALAALPWAGGQDTGLGLLRMFAAASIIAALLWGYDRLARGGLARRWARAYLVLDAALLLALLWAAYAALQNRLA
ncbi:MAG TPA: hypothetical protein VFU22_23555 [Roseiflexaceae bacterium]|nr:hypothetical protein [Roseiflexaceae bacterium]